MQLGPTQDPISAKQWYIVVVSLVSVLLWCLNTLLQRWTGEMGIIAILPMVAFYGFGILNKVRSGRSLQDICRCACCAVPSPAGTPAPAHHRSWGCGWMRAHPAGPSPTASPPPVCESNSRPTICRPCR